MTKKILSVFAALAVALGTLLVVSSPAQAGNPTWMRQQAAKWTSYCPCYVGDTYDGTYFKRDGGGLAKKIVIMKSGKMYGKVEFHPYGEHLWIYDLYDDEYRIAVNVTYTNGRGIAYRKAPNGGYKDHNLSIAENVYIDLKIKTYRVRHGHIVDQESKTYRVRA